MVNSTKGRRPDINLAAAVGLAARREMFEQDVCPNGKSRHLTDDVPLTKELRRTNQAAFADIALSN